MIKRKLVYHHEDGYNMDLEGAIKFSGGYKTIFVEFSVPEDIEADYVRRLGDYGLGLVESSKSMKMALTR